jgi:hypothetical protein
LTLQTELRRIRLMPIYDVECAVTFGRAVGADEQRAFNEAAGVSHPGWHGPQPVISWKGTEEAVIFLVLRGPGSEEPASEETVRRDAEARIRGWAGEAGLAGESPDAVTVRVEAIPRP